MTQTCPGESRTLQRRRGSAVGLGVLSVAVHAWDRLKEVTIIFITSAIVWPQVNQFSSVTQLCPILCNSMDCSTPGLPVHHQSRSLLKLMSIQLVMPFNHLILCHPLLLLPSVFTSIRVFSNESALHIRWPKYWSFSFNINPSMLNITHYQRNANQNHNEVPLHASQDGCYPKVYKQ